MHPDVHAETRADEPAYIMSATKEVVGRISLLESGSSVVAALRGSPLARLNRWYRHCAIAPMLGIGNGAAQVRKVAR